MGQNIREKQKDAGVVPATENGVLTGMVTDRDIAIRVVAERKNPQSTAVPAVPEEEGRLVGVVAQADVARDDGNDTKTGQVVQEISQ